jgi:ribonuclease I
VSECNHLWLLHSWWPTNLERTSANLKWCRCAAALIVPSSRVDALVDLGPGRGAQPDAEVDAELVEEESPRAT